MSLRDDVLEALRYAGAAGVSGEALATELGVSRMAVSKHVAALRDAGYRIGSRSGVGYVLLGAPDAPLPAEVRHRLASTMWVRLEGGFETASTNADAIALAREGAPHGTAVLAARQSAGRGRLGRAWESPKGGSYVSALLRPALAPAALSGLPLAVAVGIAGVLAGRGVEVALKWPNDLLLGDGKLAGVLLEMAAEADMTEWVVVGVGLNTRRPSHATPGAAYLEDVIAGISPADATAIVLDGIATGYRLLIEEGFEAVRAAFEPLDALRGAQVRVRDATGELRAEGIAGGIDGDGRLLVDTGRATVPLSAGDVTLAGDA